MTPEVSTFTGVSAMEKVHSIGKLQVNSVQERLDPQAINISIRRCPSWVVNNAPRPIGTALFACSIAGVGEKSDLVRGPSQTLG